MKRSSPYRTACCPPSRWCYLAGFVCGLIIIIFIIIINIINIIIIIIIIITTITEVAEGGFIDEAVSKGEASQDLFPGGSRGCVCDLGCDGVCA